MLGYTCPEEHCQRNAKVPFPWGAVGAEELVSLETGSWRYAAFQGKKNRENPGHLYQWAGCRGLGEGPDLEGRRTPCCSTAVIRQSLDRSVPGFPSLKWV